MLLFCWEDGDNITQKGVSELKARAFRCEFTSIMYKLSQAELVASQSRLSDRAEDVSAVYPGPVWFPLTNITAVAPGS